MESQRAPQRFERAKSHAAKVTVVLLPLVAAGAPWGLVGCGPAEVETPEAHDSSADPGAGEGADGPSTDSGSTAATDDLDLMVPIFGERRLAKDAIEIDPYVLVPRDQPVSEEARQVIVDLVRALQPLDPTLTSDHHDRWFIENTRRIAALEMETREDVGWAALHAFTNYPLRHFPIRRVLLGIGARVSPKQAESLLVELSFNYGYNLEDRAEAVLLLGEIAPDALFAGARPYLERQGKPFQTAPNDEFFARAWVKACEVSGESPVEMMSQVATNLALEDYARVVAIRTLGEHGDDPRARGALRTTLVESTGNGYIRRVSAQSVLAGFSREGACELLQEVLEREADVGFAHFLDDMVQLNCR
ncbi:MAG: hypothetical protein AAF957_11600 [Planctomycetota bacterium]